MKRCPIALRAKPPTLALGGKIAAIAAERFPTADAPMGQSDRAAFWLGEYLNARQMLPHLKPSELLDVIKEHDEQACGPTFTRTIKRLAQEHSANSKAKSLTVSGSQSRKAPSPRTLTTAITRPVEATIKASVAPVPQTPNAVSDDQPCVPDIESMLNRMRATGTKDDQ